MTVKQLRTLENILTSVLAGTGTHEPLTELSLARAIVWNELVRRQAIAEGVRHVSSE